ncbi:amidohydrolase [Ramaria rubella]|nr:amidohydrolase [Ramaria rubella]
MSNVQAGCLSFFEWLRRKRPTVVSPTPHNIAEVDSKHSIKYGAIPCACDLSEFSDEIWGDNVPPPYNETFTGTPAIFKPEILKTIEEELDGLDPALRELSLKIHDHPELGFEEKYAHDTLTTFMSSYGFSVTKHFLGLETAWKATFSHGHSGRVIGVNSEMDALPGIGHACGHNLIAIVGVGVSLAIKAALQKHNIPGKIVLLGTPAEEGGGGKVILIKRGGYKDMDACLMAHPGPGAAHSAGTGPCKAVQSINVEYFGHTAHASAAPWEGQNALDAAFIAYSSVSALRQQINPTHRVHGIVEGRDWAANIIPDYAKMSWIVRAPTWEETEVLRDRVIKCFEAAALATDTKVKWSLGTALYDLAQNDVLAQSFADVATQKYNVQVSSSVEGAIGGSTDFGNVTYALPAIHPSYSIPTKPNGGNHTSLFTAAARTQEAHDASMVIAKALAHTGFRVINDDEFFEKVKSSFDKKFTEAEGGRHL